MFVLNCCRCDQHWKDFRELPTCVRCQRSICCS